MFATNCWLIAPEAGGECLIVDPGMPDLFRGDQHFAPVIELAIEEYGLKPVAALLTHGHLDHTFSVTPLADGYGISAYIHSEDLPYVGAPQGLHGAEFNAALGDRSFHAPQSLKALRNGDVLNFLDMSIEAIHAPGHTKGSLMYLLDNQTLLSGDVLFAGSIGRTDLPTGSMSDMKKTLQTKILPLNDDVRVLPGHGDETTIKYERRNNPYLKEYEYEV